MVFSTSAVVVCCCRASSRSRVLSSSSAHKSAVDSPSIDTLGALRLPTRRRLLAGLRAVSRRLMSPPRLTTVYYHTTDSGLPHCASQQIRDFDVCYGSFSTVLVI